ncbi:MAG TPA: anthranilate synthase component I [Candidatus Eisenbacteria bacterium]
MLENPGPEGLRERSANGNLVPVHREIAADLMTPVAAFLRIDGPNTESFLLESVEGGERLARYSFLGRDPFLAVTIHGRYVQVVDHRAGTTRIFEARDPRAALRELLAPYRAARVGGLPRFTGGAVGWFGYDTVRWIEELPERARDDRGLADVELRLFDTVLAFDHARGRLVLIANAHVGDAVTPEHFEAAWADAVARLDRIESMLTTELPATPAARAPEAPAAPNSNMRREEFEAMVTTALEHIRAGDIFQVVLSQRFEVPTTARPFDLYRSLRTVNPSPYMYFLNYGRAPVVGSSPEPLVRLHDGRLEYRPIAGTCPRGADEEEDARNAAALAGDDKERAEHIMLVDLGRNDLGRVAEPGSVVVSDLMIVESYSHVMHLVSRLTARLRAGCDALDALFACFPAGTVSGAPKVRAMEIIEALEPTRRGLYAGAVGYLDFAGNLDTAIALRTMVVEDGVAYIQAGAGIVADSKPAREYEETRQKARALVTAIERAGSRGLA